MLPPVTSTTLGNEHSCSFSSVPNIFCPPSPPLPIKWAFSPHNKVYIRQEQGEWVCFTHSPNKVRIPFIFTKIHHLIILFSIYTHYLNTWSTPPHHHPRKRALMLIFKGGYLFSITTTLRPSKTSICTRFRWWLLVFYHHHHATVETEHTCSVSMVVFHHHHPTIEG